MSQLRCRPKAIAFDVNETLFSIESMRSSFELLGLPKYALEWWFAVVLRSGFGLAAAGDFQSFKDLAAEALSEVTETLGISLDEGTIEATIAGLAELQPHTDVEPAFRILVEERIPAITLTNGGIANVTKLLEKSQLSRLVSNALSVEEIGHWKPRPEPYNYLCEKVGVPSQFMALVAVHSWDVNGASKAGLTSGWVSRADKQFPKGINPPDVQGKTLVEVVEKLLSLPERNGAN